MTARRVTAIPLFLLGGLLLLAVGLASIAGEIYFGYTGIKQIIDGDVVAGLATFFVTSTVVIGVLSLLTLPASGLMALGGHLWGEDG